MRRPTDMLLRIHCRMIQGKSAAIVVKDIKKGYNMVFMESLTNK
jgi:hypothetical protein